MTRAPDPARPARQLAKAGKPARRSARRYPSRFDPAAPDYAGVVWADAAWRLVVSPRGSAYAVQSPLADGGWRDDRRFPGAETLRCWLACIAYDPPSGLVTAADDLPENPAACAVVPFRRAAPPSE